MKFSTFILLISILCSAFISNANAKETITKNQKINLYNAQQRANNFEECKDIFPAENPEQILQPTFINSNKWQLRRLCSNDFAVLYSGLSKTPLLVVEKLNSKILSQNIARNDDFFADPRLPTQQRAQLSDYRGLTDIDRGHLAPARNSSTVIGMAQTFAFSNIIPQNAQNNRNSWKKIESDTYKYASRTQTDVYIFTGVLFEKKELTEKVGKNQIWKPSHLYKVVYHPEKNKSWAFVIANKPNQDIKQISYEKFVQTTGIKFGVLEQNFKPENTSWLSTLLTGSFILDTLKNIDITQVISENWSSLKQNLNTLWSELLTSIVSWLKNNDKKDTDN